MNVTSAPSWQLPGTIRDTQSVTADWTPIASPSIHDVTIFESRWVTKSNGRLAEMYRRDWLGAGAHVDQVFQVILNGGRVSAWHVHEHTTDRLTIAAGHVRLVLYDARAASPTHRRLLELLLSAHRPQIIVVPPGIWHGVENVDNTSALIVNMPDRAYDYVNPDHWRLPPDTGEIPYRFRGTPTAATLI